MRSPGKNLDLKLGSLNEEEGLNDSFAEPVVAAPAAVAQVKQDQTKRPAKRRQSLRLKQKQATPNKAESPTVVKRSIKKKGNKKRRQSSSHYGFSTTSSGSETEIMDFMSNDEKPMSNLSSSKQKHRTKRRQSDCFGIANSSGTETKTSTIAIKLIVTKKAQEELAVALDSIASIVESTIKDTDDIDSLDDDDASFTEKENADTISATKSKKGRRDTFDLSRKRGLRVGPSVLEGSNTKIMPLGVHELEKVEPAGITIDTSKHQDNLFKNELFITPKNSEVTVDVGAEISSTMKDDPHRGQDAEVSEEAKARMEELTSIAIEATMKIMFSEFKVYNYVRNATYCFKYLLNVQ